MGSQRSDSVGRYEHSSQVAGTQCVPHSLRVREQRMVLERKPMAILVSVVSIINGASLRPKLAPWLPAWPLEPGHRPLARSNR